MQHWLVTITKRLEKTELKKESHLPSLYARRMPFHTHKLGRIKTDELRSQMTEGRRTKMKDEGRNL